LFDIFYYNLIKEEKKLNENKNNEIKIQEDNLNDKETILKGDINKDNFEKIDNNINENSNVKNSENNDNVGKNENKIYYMKIN
jgi:hypothetical protein